LLLDTNKFEKKPYEIPFYKQYYGLCFPTCFLMVNPDYHDIPAVINKFSINKNDGFSESLLSNLEYTIHKRTPFNCFNEVTADIIKKLDYGPVLLSFKGSECRHIFAILGYKGYKTITNNNQEIVGDYSDLTFIVHDPLEGPYIEWSFNKLKSYYSETMYTKSYLNTTKTKLSFHMPDYTVGKDKFHIGGASGVVFKNDGSVVDYIFWDQLSSSGYRLYNSVHNHYTLEENQIDINSFNTIEFKDIPVYNTEKTNIQSNPSLKIRTRILRNHNEIYTMDSNMLTKVGYNYPVDDYSINWKKIKDDIGINWSKKDFFHVYVDLIESKGSGDSETEGIRGSFDFLFTPKQ